MSGKNTSTGGSAHTKHADPFDVVREDDSVRSWWVRHIASGTLMFGWSWTSRTGAEHACGMCNQAWRAAGGPDLLAACKTMDWLTPLAMKREPDADRCAACPTCQSPWTYREVRAMVRNRSGSCMCGRWSFDMHDAIALAEGDA